MTLSLPLLALLVLVLIGAVTIAFGAYQANRRRMQTLVRAGVGAASGASIKVPLITLPDDKSSLSMRIGGVAERLLPDGAASAGATQMLIQAGFESPAAPAIYA